MISAFLSTALPPSRGFRVLSARKKAPPPQGEGTKKHAAFRYVSALPTSPDRLKGTRRELL